MRLIDADALREKVVPYTLEKGCVIGRHSGIADAILELIDNAPTIDAEPVRHGKWEEEDERSAYKDFLVSCSVCGAFLDERKKEHFRYCYNCGAKMNGGDRE